MKISPLAEGSGVPSQSLVETGRTPMKLAAAKAIASGQAAPSPEEHEQTDRQERSLKRITMKTMRSPDRAMSLPSEVVSEEAETTQNAILDPNAEAQTLEETKPLSPQFAALARQKRAIQVKEMELAKREEALKSAPANDGRAQFLAELKDKTLDMFQEAGLSYEELAQKITQNPLTAESVKIKELETKISALEKGVDTKLSDRDAQAEKDALAYMQKDAEALVAVGDDYEMIRETKSVPDVIRLIEKTYRNTKEVLDVEEACRLVEEDLINESLKITRIKKLQSKIGSSQIQQQQTQLPQRTIRTLTNRDAAPPTLDRRTRAIMAMQGQLKK